MRCDKSLPSILPRHIPRLTPGLGYLRFLGGIVYFLGNVGFRLDRTGEVVFVGYCYPQTV